MKDKRTGKPVKDFGFSEDDIFTLRPWTRAPEGGESCRIMKFINPHNGDQFTEWYKGDFKDDKKDIQEVGAQTLGEPEGVQEALKHFYDGTEYILSTVEEAEQKDKKSYTYMYTAHPDKHMHKLGTHDDKVKQVIHGIDNHIEGLWKKLEERKLDVTLLVTADHGHVTVEPDDMVEVPEKLLDCCEYANVGVSGKGRQAFFHCRSGRDKEFQKVPQ